jgi:hypothetical protein
VGPRLTPVIWWHHTPDRRALTTALDESHWLVLDEGDDRSYRGRDLRRSLTEAVDGPASAPWIVALADQAEAAVAGLVP